MFLSSLLVFVSIVQGNDNIGLQESQSTDERWHDAVLYVLDLFTKFPPVLRYVHIIIRVMTPTTIENTTLSHAMFEVINRFVPTVIIGSDQARVFGGARLFFGFVVETAEILRHPTTEASDESTPDNLPYFSAFQRVDIRDFKTKEVSSLMSLYFLQLI